MLKTGIINNSIIPLLITHTLPGRTCDSHTEPGNNHMPSQSKLTPSSTTSPDWLQQIE